MDGARFLREVDGSQFYRLRYSDEEQTRLVNMLNYIQSTCWSRIKPEDRDLLDELIRELNK
jgi:hypothetical protein